MRDRIRTFPAPVSPPPSTSGGHGWTLESVAAGLAEALKKRGHTVAVSECTSGGLLAASLLSLPGASAYFTGGAVAYAAVARQALIPGTHDELRALELVRGSDNYASPERYWESRVVWATSAARDVRLRCGADWGIAEVGAAGPSFHRATGVDAASGSGFAVVAVVGPPADERAEADRVWVRVCETGHARRDENMWQFAAAAASLAAQCVEGSEPADNAEKKKDAGDDVRNDEWREALDAAMRVVR
jgi:nicotinamide mononucleotide (NMN) deamidase PncC